MADITIAGSEPAFQELFKVVRDNFTISESDSGTFGPFSASYNLQAHLENGTVQLNNDNTIEVNNLDVVFDALSLQVCFAIPGWCTPSFCLVPDPWNGCLVGFPSICIPPGGGTTICVGIDLSGLVTEINEFLARLKTVYFVDPARLASESDLDAEFAGHPNKWQIFIDPIFVSLDPIDLPATIGNLFEQAVEDAINALIPSWVPDWAVDLLWSIIGPVIDLIKGILGILDTIEDFLSDLLGNQFDILSPIATAIADLFASQNPIYEFEDPFPVLPGAPGLIPVKIPIRGLAAEVNSDEIIITADVGA